MEKGVEEMKKELLEWIVKEILEDLELINKADDNLTFQATLECIKEYEKHLQNEKKKKKKKEKKLVLHTNKDKFWISSKNPKNSLTF